MKGYLLDIQGSQGTWIPYIYTRVPVYTGIPGYLDMQERQGIWIYRDTRVSGYTGIAWFWVYRDIRVPVSTRIHGYQGTWINRDISVPRCTWISMYISTQLNPRCLLIKILNTTHSFYLLIYLSTTPWVYDIFMARKTGCKMNLVQFRLIFRHFKYYIKRLLWKRPIWWLEDEPTKRNTAKYCKPLKIWSFYDIWEKFLKEFHGSAFGFKNKHFFQGNQYKPVK